MKYKRYLEIGPNPDFLPGKDWDTADIIGDSVTFKFDLGNPPFPIDDNIYEIIYMSHVLEHIPWHDVPKSLLDIHRILKPGGRVEIIVPDLQKLIAAYIAPTLIKQDSIIWRVPEEDKLPCVWLCARLYGHTFGNKGDENWHKGCFDVELLYKRLKDAGFINIRFMDKVRGYDHGYISLAMSGEKPK